MNTTETVQENTQAAATKTNWMLETAGLVFWIAVIAQILLLWHGTRDREITDFLMYNALPLAGVLAYFGIRREQLTAQKDKESRGV